MLTNPLSTKVNQPLEPFQNPRNEAWGKIRWGTKACGSLRLLVSLGAGGGFLDSRLAALFGTVRKRDLCCLEPLLLPGSFLKRFAQRLSPGSWLVKPAWLSRLVQRGRSLFGRQSTRWVLCRGWSPLSVRGHHAICAAACCVVGSPPGSPQIPRAACRRAAPPRRGSCHSRAVSSPAARCRL